MTTVIYHNNTIYADTLATDFDTGEQFEVNKIIRMKHYVAVGCGNLKLLQRMYNPISAWMLRHFTTTLLLFDYNQYIDNARTTICIATAKMYTIYEAEVCNWYGIKFIKSKIVAQAPLKHTKEIFCMGSGLDAVPDMVQKVIDTDPISVITHVATLDYYTNDRITACDLRTHFLPR